jgi:hypothetical protein
VTSREKKENHMKRSTILLLTSAACGIPSLFMDVNSLTGDVKAAWLAVMLTIALAGFFFWAKDRA